MEGRQRKLRGPTGYVYWPLIRTNLFYEQPYSNGISMLLLIFFFNKIEKAILSTGEKIGRVYNITWFHDSTAIISHMTYSI